jgi:hypothetical protein
MEVDTHVPSPAAPVAAPVTAAAPAAVTALVRHRRNPLGLVCYNYWETNIRIAVNVAERAALYLRKLINHASGNQSDLAAE